MCIDANRKLNEKKFKVQLQEETEIQDPGIPSVYTHVNIAI